MDTYAADVVALTDALELKGAFHVGHSTGGGEVERARCHYKVHVGSSHNERHRRSDNRGSNPSGPAALGTAPTFHQFSRKPMSISRREGGEPSRRMVEQPRLEPMIRMGENKQSKQQQRDPKQLLSQLAGFVE